MAGRGHLPVPGSRDSAGRDRRVAALHLAAEDLLVPFGLPHG
ncbi:MAG TPA: hypothetical protein VL984_10115 [Acidimicrobiales bacterium]|nr:hypothetical protein [Acidimicrobiales bacterium]